MIGDNIKKIREQKKYKLSQLAKKCGISAGYLSDIEKNIKTNPSLDVLNKISEVLDIPLNELLSTEEKLNIMADSMIKINKMTKDALEHNRIFDPTCGSSSFLTKISDILEEHPLTENESNEVINYIQFLLSKRKE